MDKEFYDKYGKEFDCASCIHLEQCMKQDKPVLITCVNQQYENKIADLEAKLAEKEKALLLAMSKLNIKEHQPAYCKLAGRDCECMGKVEELKQQLEEKEKELEEINREFVQSTHDWKEIVKEKKTEFAIQQLERVKEKTKSFYGEYSASVAVYFIDQIIKELEGETK